MAVTAYADGSGNTSDGPACIGVVVMEDEQLVVEVSEFTGLGTNNVAELRAVQRAMRLLHNMYGWRAPAAIYTDSLYVINMVAKILRRSRVNKNVDLVNNMRKQFDRFESLEMRHVRGHAGVYGNEVADWLAGRARRAHLNAKYGWNKTHRSRPAVLP